MEENKVYVAMDIIRLGKENVGKEVYEAAEKVVLDSLNR